MKAAFFLLGLACGGQAWAGGPGTDAAAFLKIDSAARPMALGGAFAALADDANAVFYNPAGLVQLEKKEAALTHNEWIASVRSEYLAYGHTTKSDVTYGFGLNYLFTGDITRRNSDGNETGSFTGSDGAAVFCAAKNFGEYLALGGGGKLIRQSVDDKSAMSVAADAGAMYFLYNFRFGLAVQNLGKNIALGGESFPLPLTYRAGASAVLFKSLALAADYVKATDNSGGMRFGAEYAATGIVGGKDKLFLRGGYRASRSDNTGSGFSCGAGFSLSGYQFDYAFSPMGDLGNTHRLTLTLRFGASRGDYAMRHPRSSGEETKLDPKIYTPPQAGKPQKLSAEPSGKKSAKPPVKKKKSAKKSKKTGNK